MSNISSTQQATLHHRDTSETIGGVPNFFQAPIRNKTLLSLSFNETKALAMLISVRRHQATHPNEAKDYTTNRLHEITGLHATTFALYKGGHIATERFVNDMAVATVIKYLIKENEKLKKGENI